MAFKAVFFNQGRVDSILLQCDGESAFIDGGYRRNGEKVVTGYLNTIGLNSLRYYIASHGHKNHIGAAVVLIEQYRPDTIICGRKEVLAAIKKYAKTKAEDAAVASATPRYIGAGHVFQLGSATITCLGPVKQKSVSCGAYSENYNSLILRVDYEGKPLLLLTGDSTASIIAKCGSAAKAEILKSPHHAGSQPASLLKQVKPSAVVICSNVRAGSAYRKRITSAGAVVWNVCEGRVELEQSPKGDFLLKKGG